jgi:hypothetical protein
LAGSFILLSRRSCDWSGHPDSRALDAALTRCDALTLTKDILDEAIFCVLLYSWCRVSALINLTVADYYERGD